jgi:hypothetical protein
MLEPDVEVEAIVRAARSRIQPFIQHAPSDARNVCRALLNQRGRRQRRDIADRATPERARLMIDAPTWGVAVCESADVALEEVHDAVAGVANGPVGGRILEPRRACELDGNVAQADARALFGRHVRVRRLAA